jgi:hypothetical protein
MALIGTFTIYIEGCPIDPLVEVRCLQCVVSIKKSLVVSLFAEFCFINDKIRHVHPHPLLHG